MTITSNNLSESTESNSNNRTQQLISTYGKYVANHYHPTDNMVIAEGKDYFVKKTDGGILVDFFSSYSAANQGHSHPEIIKALIKQSLKLTVTSGAYYNEPYAELSKLVSETFGYEKMLPCNGGAEAVESAIKIAVRNWHERKKSEKSSDKLEDKDTAIIVWAKNAYHGQSGGVWSALSSTEFREGFNPGPANRRVVPYGDIKSLEYLFKKEGKNIAGFLVEPIQGEAGVILPPDGYFKDVRALCDKYNIILIMDEIQAGMGRSGKILCQEYYGIRGDIVTLAKSVSGGVGPMSLVLADDKFMKVLGPGGHGSTFGGNPLMSAVAIAAINVMKNENLVEKSAENGEYFLNQLKTRLGKFIAQDGKSDIIKEIRGKGLFIGIEFSGKDSPIEDAKTAIPMRDALIDAGIMCKQTKDVTLRISPPLTITREAIDAFVEIAEEVCTKIARGQNLKQNPVTPKIMERLEKKGIKAPIFDKGLCIIEETAREIRSEQQHNSNEKPHLEIVPSTSHLSRLSKDKRNGITKTHSL